PRVQWTRGPGLTEASYRRTPHPATTSMTRLRSPQRPLNLGDGRHARLVAAVFDAVERLGADAGAAGEFGLRQAEPAAGAEDGAGLRDGGVFVGGAVAVEY